MSLPISEQIQSTEEITKEKKKKSVWRKKLKAKKGENSANAWNAKIFPRRRLILQKKKILQEANAAKLRSEEFSG
jgi:hypothetical protein